MNAFFAMGGYAAFVWPAYALTAAVLIGLWGLSMRSLRQREQELAQIEAEQGGRRRRP